MQKEEVCFDGKRVPVHSSLYMEIFIVLKCFVCGVRFGKFEPKNAFDPVCLV